MNKDIPFNALCYELALFAIHKWPPLALNLWVKALLAWCKPYWAQWKTEQTIKKVDEQVVVLVKQWEKEERVVIATKLAEKVKELFPAAEITPMPDAIVPSVMIVHEAPDSASDGVKALGGELRITWTLDGLS